MMPYVTIFNTNGLEQNLSKSNYTQEQLLSSSKFDARNRVVYNFSSFVIFYCGNTIYDPPEFRRNALICDCI